ncbi:acyl-CoA-binding domain-containing protein 4 [Eublepharis macularius]|uniref:Acyl-CoA-binding domain-containing protein 4 n=1 Tax=Eublepharis macularius TaxID=481883 RepID=A0AA97LCN3_EUBMA|nr:acyl-CoA-binding domain-containing protein 4 [Eublepharis macularius]XP_054850925.1 acyl-CoA-binding domain-containing protein 4 [Eublepharis macularius]
MGLKAEEPDYQKQFEAAVRVIQGLPKKGSSYRPSYEEMLRFYSYYKQATVGQCQISRPGFWDPIGRYKWDAWNRLGKMTKKEAMVAYVQEMKKSAQKVIDTVPLDQTSEDMFEYFEPLYEVIDDMPRPPDSFFKKKLGLGHAEESVKSTQGTSDSESEVFCDSLEQVEADQVRRLSAKESFSVNNLHEIQPGETGKHQLPMHVPISTREEELSKSDLRTTPAQRDFGSSPRVTVETMASASIRQEVDVHMRSTIQTLQEDMEEVMRRLSNLESLVTSQGQPSKLKNCQSAKLHKEPSHWPAHLTPPTLFFLLAWPFIVQWLLWRFQSRKR